MTKRQAELINSMYSQHYNSATYKDAYRELLSTCSDALVQPTVTVTTGTTPTVTGTTGTTPPPPSTPKPLGPEWWKERQAEAVQEQIEIIKAQAQKIQSLQKQIAENRAYWDNKAVIDKGYREHNDELVAANGEIYEALKHWGLDQSGPCSLVDNVKHVIQLCADRGKAHFDLKDKIERLNDQIDSQSKVIAELKKDRNASIIASNQILGALNQTSLRKHDGSLADNVVDVINQCVAQEKKIEILDKENYRLEKHIENLKSFSRDDQEINHRKTVEIEALKKQLAVAGKKRQTIVEVGNKLRDRLRIMANQYYMLQEEHVENSNAIALWEDNTTP